MTTLIRYHTRLLWYHFLTGNHRAARRQAWIIRMLWILKR